MAQGHRKIIADFKTAADKNMSQLLEAVGLVFEFLDKDGLVVGSDVGFTYEEALGRLFERDPAAADKAVSARQRR